MGPGMFVIDEAMRILCCYGAITPIDFKKLNETIAVANRCEKLNRNPRIGRFDHFPGLSFLPSTRAIKGAPGSRVSGSSHSGPVTAGALRAMIVGILLLPLAVGDMFSPVILSTSQGAVSQLLNPDTKRHCQLRRHNRYQCHHTLRVVYRGAGILEGHQLCKRGLLGDRRRCHKPKRVSLRRCHHRSRYQDHHRSHLFSKDDRARNICVEISG